MVKKMITIEISEIKQTEEITDTENEDEELQSSFESIYNSLKELDSNCSEFTRQFQDYRKKIEAQSLVEQELYPKPHATHWFKKNNLPIPCLLETFIEAFLREEAQKDRICSEERSIILGKQARHLFKTEKKKVGWMELLALVPNVFE